MEVNVSFYRLVPSHTYVNWAELTPPDFLFDVKAFQELTHFRDPPPDETFAAFRTSFGPLRDMDRLGGVLFQFPPRFANTPVSRNYLRRVAREMRGDVSVVEFRNHSWLAPEHRRSDLRAAGELGLAYASRTSRRSQRHRAADPAVTNPAFAYIRLHGRNAETWYRGGGGGTRYDYDYSAAELAEWARHRQGPRAASAPGPRPLQQQCPRRGHPQRAGIGPAPRYRTEDAPELPPQQPRLFAEDD